MAKGPQTPALAAPQEEASEAQSQEQTSQETPSPGETQSQTRPPSTEKPESKKDEHQSFVAVFNIVDGVTTYAPGETVKLSRQQFDTLKTLGAIEGDWKQ